MECVLSLRGELFVLARQRGQIRIFFQLNFGFRLLNVAKCPMNSFGTFASHQAMRSIIAKRPVVTASWVVLAVFLAERALLGE